MKMIKRVLERRIKELMEMQRHLVLCQAEKQTHVCCEKNLEIRRQLYTGMCTMDIKKAFDGVPRKVME